MSSRRDFLSIVASAFLLGPEIADSQNPLQIIVVKTRTEAEQILERLNKGQYFSYLAKQFSVDPSSKEGGYVTTSWFSHSPQGLEAALQHLNPGQVGAITETPQGFLLVKVLSDKDAAWFEHLRVPNQLIPRLSGSTNP